jgi:molecular chaperone HtpG
MYNDKDDKGLQLYTKGVFILEKCKELIPDYLRFVKGLVDSADLPLNISRETLQEDRAIKKIAANVEKKILAELSRMVKNDREKYEEFYKDWGRHLKFGLYENYGERKDSLKDLILLRSFNEDKLITFSEYVEKMPESQKEIYYAIGNDKAAVEKLPQMDLVKSKGYDVFILSEDIDEFMITVLKSYNEKPFKSINKDELDLIDEEEKKKLDELKEEKKEFLSEVKESIPSVKEVIISKKLVDAPCCVSSTGELSFEMERVLKQQNQEVKAERVFELNPNHPMFAKLEALYKADKDEASRMTKLLYTEALLQEGILPDDPKAFAEDLNALLMK